MRLRRLAPVTLLVIALAATPAAAQPSGPGGQGPGHGPGHGKRALSELGLPQPGAPDRAVENYTLIEAELLLPHPDEWGGAYVDGNKLVVNTVTRSVQEARAELHRIGVRGPVEIQQVGTSMAALEAASQAVLSDDVVSEAVASVGPDYSQSRVVVGMRSDVDTTVAEARLDDVVAELAAADPEGTVIPLEAYDGGAPVETGRYYDTSPFYGGNNVRFSSTNGANGCSTGFAWVASSVTYLVTASHCARSTSGSRNTVSRYLSGGSTSTIGTVTWTSGGTSGTTSGRRGDLAMVKLSSGLSASARVFTGTYNTSTSVVVKGRQSLPQGWKGSNLRSSGSGPYYGNGDGEINPDWVSLVNQTIKYSNGQTYTSLSFAEHASSCFGGGDSGGAMYVTVSGGANGVGIISGTNNQGAGLTNCRNYFTPLSYVAADFGGAIKAG